jgi:hypothetical protein
MSEGTLSILCADVSGSERLYEKLAASEAAHAIGRCEKRIAQTVEGFNGRLAKCAGSRVMAYFAEAEDALQSAVEMQRSIAKLPPMSGVALSVRVGVCVGHASNEIRFFDQDTNNAASSLSGMAEPGQVLLSVPKRAKGFEWEGRVARSRPEVSLSCGNRHLGVFEIDWRTFGVSQLKPVAVSEAEADSQLYLHFNGSTIELSDARPLLSIGRLASCGMLLQNTRCSRVHARIERRGDGYVLVDQSTNGTFVLPEGGTEHALRKHEIVLSGRGKISFGVPFSATKNETDNADWAHYVIAGPVAPSRF